MRTPINAKDFAEYYLRFKLGDRSGLDIREVVQSEEIEQEIIQELATCIEERDRLIVAGQGPG